MAWVTADASSWTPRGLPTFHSPPYCLSCQLFLFKLSLGSIPSPTVCVRASVPKDGGNWVPRRCHGQAATGLLLVTALDREAMSCVQHAEVTADKELSPSCALNYSALTLSASLSSITLSLLAASLHIARSTVALVHLTGLCLVLPRICLVHPSNWAQPYPFLFSLCLEPMFLPDLFKGPSTSSMMRGVCPKPTQPNSAAVVLLACPGVPLGSHGWGGVGRKSAR